MALLVFPGTSSRVRHVIHRCRQRCVTTARSLVMPTQHLLCLKHPQLVADMGLNGEKFLYPFLGGLFQLPSMNHMAGLESNAYLVEDGRVFLQLDLLVEQLPHSPWVVITPTSRLFLYNFWWLVLISIVVLVVGVGRCQRGGVTA